MKKVKIYLQILLVLTISVNQTIAQNICTDFNNEETTGELGNVMIRANSTINGLIDNPWGNWYLGCTYMGIYNDQNSLDGTNYLFLKDEGCSDMGSKAWNSIDFSGNWIENANCFCYNYNVINNGTNDMNPPSALTIYSGLDPSTSNSTATFVLNSPIAAGSGWHTICPPISISDIDGNLPSNSLGFWRMNNNGTANDWNNLITNVGGIQFSVDIGNIPSEEYGLDNICFQSCPPNQMPNTMIFPCCQTPLDIFVPSGSPEVLPITIQTRGDQEFSSATETFQIHKSATIPIIELRVVVTDIHYDYDYSSCGECINNPALWGSIFSASTIGEKGLVLSSQDYNFNSSNFLDENVNLRELIWSNSDGALLQAGDLFELNYVLPSPSDIPCCRTKVKICTNISWKDANCVRCDINTCSTIQLMDTSSNVSVLNCACDFPIEPFIRMYPWDEGVFSQKNIPCGQTRSIDLFKKGRNQEAKYSFYTPIFRCKTDACGAESTWEIINDKGTIISEGVGDANFITFPSRGKFTVRFNSTCGGVKCQSCEIYVKVD